ncbi:MAG: CoA transferase [Dehalococcoidia bacterium]|nr:CoA transferase [Dehalococcoidia bacterium]
MTEFGSSRRILDGVRVVDFTRVVAGPFCSRMLADLGADVVKVDQPSAGGGGNAAERPAGSLSNNLGKRSVVLDLKQPGAGRAARALIARADVVVENFRPGVMASLGLGYQDCTALNPRIVYASISGFGQSGSHSHRRAFGATAHAEAGWLWVQQQAMGAPEPFAPGVTVADLVTGMTAFSGILAALYDREHTGRGQHVDVSLMDCQFQMLSEVAGPTLNGQPPESWEPFRHPIHRTRDGRHVTINLGPPHMWPRIASALGHEGTPRPPTAAEANALVGAWVAQLDSSDIGPEIDRSGAAYGMTLSMHEAAAHPYFRERGMIAEVQDPVVGALRVVDSPLFFSDSVSQARDPAALLGEHTREVLHEAGLSEEDVEALLESGAATEVRSPR